MVSWIPVTVQSFVRLHQWEQQPLKKTTSQSLKCSWSKPLRSKHGSEESCLKVAFLWCRASLTYLGGMLAFKYSSIWLTSAARNIFFSVNRKGTLQASTTRMRTPALRKVKSVPLTWEYKNILCCHLHFRNIPRILELSLAPSKPRIQNLSCLVYCLKCLQWYPYSSRFQFLQL